MQCYFDSSTTVSKTNTLPKWSNTWSLINLMTAYGSDSLSKSLPSLHYNDNFLTLHKKLELVMILICLKQNIFTYFSNLPNALFQMFAFLFQMFWMHFIMYHFDQTYNTFTNDYRMNLS